MGLWSSVLEAKERPGIQALECQVKALQTRAENLLAAQEGRVEKERATIEVARFEVERTQDLVNRIDASKSHSSSLYCLAAGTLFLGAGMLSLVRGRRE